MINKKYKDRLFCLLFGNEEYKDNILSLYNALCNTSYTNTDDIQIYTIEDCCILERCMISTLQRIISIFMERLS